MLRGTEGTGRIRRVDNLGQGPGPGWAGWAHTRFAAAGGELRAGSWSRPAPSLGPRPRPGLAPPPAPAPGPAPPLARAASSDLPARLAARTAVSATRARALVGGAPVRAGAGLGGASTGPWLGSNRSREIRGIAPVAAAETPAGPGGRGGLEGVGVPPRCAARGLPGPGDRLGSAHRPGWGRLKEFPDAGPRNSAFKGLAVSALFASPPSADAFADTRGA